MKIKIPKQFKTGAFKVSELNKSPSAITLDYNEHNNLSYKLNQGRGTVTIYSVSEDLLKNNLTAVYDDNGNLEKIEITDENKTRLVYIRYDDIHIAREIILEFIEAQAKQISDEIIRRNVKLARLFTESFYDGDAVDISVKTATAEEVQAVIGEYGDDDDYDVTDSSGNFPVENRIELNREMLRVMLLCTPNKFRDMLFTASVRTFVNYIKENLLDKIDKTDDFKFISEEYD